MSFLLEGYSEKNSGGLVEYTNLRSIMSTEYYLNTFAKTKIIIPNVPAKNVNRIRLLKKLDTITEYKCGVVSAPAGFGKTTLVSTWSNKHTEDMNISWVSLSEEDNDLYSFWFYVALAIEQFADINVDNILSMLSTEYRHKIEVIINMLVNVLLSVKRHVIVILDDYHTIQNHDIKQSLQYFINNMSDNVHLIIICRTKIPCILARLRVRDELLEIKEEEIRFRLSEIEDYFVNNIGIKLDIDELKKIEQYTEGWIIAINMLAKQIVEKREFSNELIDHSICSNYLIDYLKEEITNKLKPELRQFLLFTSILPVMNASICNYILQINNSQEVFDMLISEGIFTAVIDEKLNYYRYHQLVQDFFKHKLIKYHYMQLDEIYIRASEWYESNGYLQEAIEFSLKAGAYSNSVKLIESYMDKLILRGEFNTLLYLTEKLPPDIIKSSNRLFLYYTMALAKLGVLDSEETYLKVKGIYLDEQCFKENEGVIYTIKSLAALYWKDSNIDRVRWYAYRALEKLEQKDDSKFSLLMKAIIYSNLGNAAIIEGALEEAVSNFENSYIFSIGSEYLYAILNAAHKTAQTYYNIGRLSEALKLYKNVLTKIEQDQQTMCPCANLLLIGIGLILYETNDLDMAYKYAVKGVELSKIYNDAATLARGYVLLAKILYAQGKKCEGIAFIQIAMDLSNETNVLEVLKQLSAHITRLIIDYEDFGLLQRFVVSIDLDLNKKQNILGWGENISLLELMINSRELDEAIRLKDYLLNKAICEKRERARIKLYIMEAIINMLRGKTTEAAISIKEAIRIAYKNRYIHIFLEYSKYMMQVLGYFKGQYTGYKAEAKFADELLGFLGEYETDASIIELNKTDNHSFSLRELEVLQCLDAGMTNKEISEKLYISVSTVKKHLKSIFEKLQVNNRTKALKAAQKLNII